MNFKLEIIAKVRSLAKERFKNFSKRNNISLEFIIISCIITTTLLVFRFPINKYLIDEKLEVPFKYIETNDPYDNFLFYLIALILLLITVKRYLIEYTVSVKRFWLISLFCLAYIFVFRFHSNPFWTLNSLSAFPFLKFLDIILIYWFFIFCIFVRNQFKSFNTENISLSAFYEDSHASYNSEDLFNRKIISETLYSYILNTNNEKAFAIGITGNWGNGKSVFLDFIKNQLSQQWIIVDFNPWRTENSQGIVKDFFLQLVNEIKPYDEEISKQVSKYIKTLINLDTTAFKQIIESSTSILGDSQSLAEQYKEIDNSIRNLDKKVIVFIDDIDRLDEQEVFEVLKIVRNTAGFGNTFFVLAYDKYYVQNFISKRNANNGASYLEKIIQFEITLPQIDSIILKKEIITKITSKLKKDVHLKVTNLILNEVYGFSNFIKNLRDVVRFANNFTFNYSSIIINDDNIVLEEFFLIELVKFKYYEDYSNIYLHNDSYFNMTGLMELKANIADIEISKSKLNPDVIKILEYLFDSKRFFDSTFEKIELNSIRRKTNFYKYFTYQIFSNDISFKKLEELISFSHNPEKINELVRPIISNNDPTIIVGRLFEYSKFTDKNYSSLLKCIVEIIKIFPSNYDNSVSVLESITNEYLEENKVNISEIVSIISIETNFIQDKPIIYLTFLEKLLKKQLNSIKTDNEKNELLRLFIKNIQFLQLEKFKLTRLHFAFLNRIFRLLKSKEGLEIFELLSIYKHLIITTEVNLKAFLESTISKEPRAYLYYINQNLKLVFGSEKNAEEEILKGSNIPFVNEYYDFYCICLINGFSEKEFVYYFIELMKEFTSDEEDKLQRMKEIIIRYDENVLQDLREIRNNKSLKDKCIFSEYKVPGDQTYFMITALENITAKQLIIDVKMCIRQVSSLQFMTQGDLEKLDSESKIIKDEHEVLSFFSIQPSAQFINENYPIY